MRKLIILCCLVMMTALHTTAQPTPVKNAYKAVFTLTTFKADGSLLASSHGVFIDNNGTAISDWSSFDGAVSAAVIDANGKRMEVVNIIGANEIYDVAKFRVDGKTTGLAPATSGLPQGQTAYLVGYSTKKAEITPLQIDKVETFMDKYSYYVIKSITPDNMQSCPLVNANGEVIGFLQHSQHTTDNHATDALYIADMQTNGLSVSDPVLRRTNIPTALPDDPKQAQVALVLASQTFLPGKYEKTIQQFIQKFPDMPEGYYSRAQQEVAANDFDAAAKDMETAIKKADQKDDAHFSYAQLIYRKEVYKPKVTYEPWSLDKALEEAKIAYDINPLPLYRHLQAQILYTKEEYQQAYDMFLDLTKTDLRTSELFYEASQCKKMLKAPKEEVLALIDSAIQVLPKPMTVEAAPYLIARAHELEENGEYRKAVADYNQYDTLMAGRLTAEFFYQREQCEKNGRLFQQALNDINRAIILQPREPLYFAEKGSLLLRFNMQKEAIETAEQCIALDPEYSDGYLIKGLALVQTGNKAAGLEALQKAQSLGNDQATSLIEKYK